MGPDHDPDLGLIAGGSFSIGAVGGADDVLAGASSTGPSSASAVTRGYNEVELNIPGGDCCGMVRILSPDKDL